jgi:hypothetical protein
MLGVFGWLVVEAGFEIAFMLSMLRASRRHLSLSSMMFSNFST